mgnify:CR=1 FL=1
MNRAGSAYPILLTALDRVQTVVIGGGRVSERKTAGLLEAKARIRLISPQVTARLQEWAAQGLLQWIQRGYQRGDLAGAWLAVVATNQREVNALAAGEARERGILCNVADAPAEGNFHVPAVYRGKREIVAVSTFSGNPALAAALREHIIEQLKKERR